MLHGTGFSHPEREAQGSVVGLKSHWSSLLQDGLMRCVQALANSRWCGVVVVVMMSRRSVVIVVVVHRLVGVIVLLLPKQVGVQVSAGVKISLFEE